MRFATAAITSALLFLYSSAHSQTTFTPLANNINWEQSLLDQITKRYQQDVSSLTGSHKKHLQEIYKERFEFIKTQFLFNEVLTAEESQSYLNQLVQEIISKNPSLEKENLRIVFSKAHYANASSMGEGTIFFNIGLFHRLSNESQAVFVLCHEIAHYILNHSNNNIHQYINTTFSEEFQKELKRIKKLEYQQNSQLENLHKNLLFKNRRHSRQFEHAADSMALELMKNTRFDVNEALSCLALLDSVDQDKYLQPLELEKVFHFTAYPFKKKWLESDDLLSFKKDEKNKALEDSLKTHPACTDRISALSDKVSNYNKNTGKKFMINEAKFNQLKQQFDLEIIEHCFNSRRVSRALYYSLQLLSIYPDNAYLYTMIGNCLNDMYIHQKNHELGKIVDLPGPGHAPDYDQLLTFIQNLRLAEIVNISYHFLETHHSTFSTDKNFNQTLENSRKLKN